MTKGLKILAVGLAALAAAGLGLAFRGGKAQQKPVRIRASISTAPNNFDLARELTGRDLLKEEGVNYQAVPIHGSGGGTFLVQALLADSIDVAGGSISIWVNAIGKGAKIKLVFPGTATEKPEHSGVLVLEKSGIRTVMDLAGKKIAVNVLGAEADFIIRTFLKQNGLSMNQVQLLVVPAENQEQVLRNGEVDAVAWTTSGGVQFDHTVENGGVRRIPGTSSFEAKGNRNLLTTCEGFTERFVKEHPDAVRAYLKAEDAARRIVWEAYRSDPERVKKAYVDVTERKGGSREMGKYYRGPRWYPENQLIGDQDIQFWIDNFVEHGILKPGQLKPSDVYTNAFSPARKGI